MKVSCKVETITPAKARQILKGNTHNRPLNEDFVLSLAQAIESGEWKLNGESIIIADDGSVIDGQHRLEAIVLSGKAIASLVARGVDPAAFETVDVGMKRTAGHMLAIDGEKNCNALASAASHAWRYENDRLFGTGRGARPRTAQLRQWIKANPGIRDSLAIAMKAHPVLTTGLGGALHFLFAKKDRAAADLFFEKLASGEGLRKTQGVYLFRERLLANKGSRVKMTTPLILALAIKAFNAHCNGDNLRCLKWAETEDFPKIAA